MAVWYRFKRDFAFKPSPPVTIAYSAGDIEFIPNAHADAADDVNAGERIDRETAKALREKDVEGGDHALG